MAPVQAWAEFRFNLTRAGAVSFVYGVDCAPGAAFTAYVDGTQAPPRAPRATRPAWRPLRPRPQGGLGVGGRSCGRAGRGAG